MRAHHACSKQTWRHAAAQSTWQAGSVWCGARHIPVGSAATENTHRALRSRHAVHTPQHAGSSTQDGTPSYTQGGRGTGVGVDIIRFGFVVYDDGCNC